ncbi:alpha/beta fold hydrolase [[Mycobacterium] zoologicum]|uniref:alpha/beta fold hydrolase n=1 Tax=[Mycobacterium] zoologicum TaxID=2872311 RepID=UPI001CDAC505|nr:alpha/beta hydrolase [Mycolicibacter sp. MYC101]MEB3062572.1 alpha/beta hydrolase [Mycolicibacter sp. MYC101]
MRSRTGHADAGGVRIFYEDLGNPDDPAVVLLAGLAAQLPTWPDGFCALLVDAGYRVIRFDHRDTGLSTKLDGAQARGSPARRAWRYLLGRTSAVPYTLLDMADDVLALLDRLGIARAHLVGVSMGGMIAQILAATAGDRVTSLGVLMSTTGRRIFTTPPAWRLIRLALQRPRDSLAFEVRHLAVLNGPVFAPPEAELRARVVALRERCNYPEGRRRHVDAILGTGSLLKYSRAISAPTVVLHGSADPMLRPAHGRAVADAVPGARFVLIEGMGHDLPAAVWQPVAGALTENFRRRFGRLQP